MNKLNQNICPFCESKNLYIVSKTSFKCVKCTKKYSFKKLQKDFEVMEYFCNDISVKECSNSLHINYKSVKDRYMDFRKLCLIYVEDVHTQNYSQYDEYDEYYYLAKHKQGKVKYLFDAIGILGMTYSNLVYTLLLPDQFAHLRAESSHDPKINYAYMKEYSKYLNRHKIVHFEQFDSQIIRFWVFLEKKLLHFKGISRENFVYYLKEYEFKFNHDIHKQKELLWELWINTKRAP